MISWSPYNDYNTNKKWTSGFGITLRGTQGIPWTGYMLEFFNVDNNTIPKGSTNGNIPTSIPPTAYIANNQLITPVSSLASRRYDPGNNSHTYSLKVKGDNVDVSIDGSPFLSAGGDGSAHGGQIGLWTTNTALAVTSFTVSTL